VAAGGGASVATTLSDESGAFSLRAPAAGSYALRAERVGYASTLSPAFALAAGQTLQRVLQASEQSVSLEGVVASGTARRCQVRPGNGELTATVWNEARKALASAAWGRQQRRLEYRVVRFERDLDPASGRVLRDTRSEVTALAAHPFASPPPAELSREGYVRRTPEGTLYYGPDAAVLVSDEFLDDHCFRLEDSRETAGDSLIGVAFEPVGGRSGTDIRGVVWLERRSAAVRRVEYTYTGLQGAVSHARLGGSVEYARTPGGIWIVRRWSIRMPQLAVAEGYRTAPRDDRPQAWSDARLAGIREAGGEVVEARLQQGAAQLAAAAGAMVTGLVWDSTSNAPLAAAEVFVSGTAWSTRSDSLGRFRLEGVAPGSYLVSFSHPLLGMLASALTPAPLRVQAGDSLRLVLSVPSLRTAASRICPDSTRGAHAGVVLGTVRAPDGSPVGAAVSASWQVSVLTPTGARALQSSRTVHANASGSYVLCGVPERALVTLAAGDAGLSAHDQVQLLPGTPLQRDLTLAAGRVAAAQNQPGAAVRVAGVTATGRMGGFEQRRRSGRGFYLAREDIERRSAHTTVDLLRGIPGVQVLRDGGGEHIQMAGETGRRYSDQSLPARDQGKVDQITREANGGTMPRGVAAGTGRELADNGGNTGAHSGLGECQVQFWLDGVPFQPMHEGRISNEIPPSEIEALEIYRSNAETPVQFRRPGSDCGTVLIWSRR
jgi:hypothetical protein